MPSWKQIHNEIKVLALLCRFESDSKRGKTPGTQVQPKVQHDRGVADEIAEIRGRYGVL
jgi:hypothetical protein